MEIISKRISKKDFKRSLDIYNYFVLKSLSNFEEKKLSINYFYSLYKNIKLNKSIDNLEKWKLFQKELKRKILKEV